MKKKRCRFFYKEASRVAEEMKASHGAEFEFIFVDDGSRDGTLRVARALHAQDPACGMSRSAATLARRPVSTRACRPPKAITSPRWTLDLQDPPALLPQMLDTLLTGEYDCAATRRTTRKGEPPLRSWFARKFYQIINKMSDTEIVDGARDFRLMSRKMTDAVLSMAEYNRFSKGIFSWVGFKTKGSTTRTSSASPVRPSGISGACSSTPSRASSASRPRRC